MPATVTVSISIDPCTYLDAESVDSRARLAEETDFPRNTLLWSTENMIGWLLTYEAGKLPYMVYRSGFSLASQQLEIPRLYSACWQQAKKFNLQPYATPNHVVS